MFKNILQDILLAIIFGILYSGLILLGWGFGDMSGFFSHLTRTIFFAVTIVVHTLNPFLKSLFNIELLKQGEKKAKDKITFATIFLVCCLIVFVAPYSDSHNLLVMGGGDVMRYLGLVLFLIGHTFMLWGPLCLGKQFSFFVTVQKEHKLTTDGPYRFMRHPRYNGGICWILGSALIFLSILGLILAIVYSIIMLLRISKEERLLHQEFGKEWEEYCGKTKKIIPFVY